ncbi:MAG TPA: hypothetical protein VMU88_07860 [bacterium]|nr:hypothetical protein [bacterium]
MGKILLVYITECLKKAWKDSVNGAFNWSGVVGVSIYGIYHDHYKNVTNFSADWRGMAESGFIYALITWVAIFIFRLIFIAPFLFWKETKEKSDSENKDLTEKDKRELIEFSKTIGNSEIKITWENTSQSAEKFAQKIKNFLRREGYTVKMLYGHALLGNGKPGIEFDIPTKTIIVGPNTEEV